jgi:hypothetical protein
VPAASEAPAPESSAPEAAAPQQAVPPPEANLMPMIDEQGHQTMVPRPVWRERVLLPHLEKVKDQPDALAEAVLQALQGGFLTDVVEPAERLAQIDTNPERGAVILSVVYRELQRWDSAETVLRQQLEKHGESVAVVFNIGLTQAARGDHEAAEQSFWRECSDWRSTTVKHSGRCWPRATNRGAMLLCRIRCCGSAPCRATGVLGSGRRAGRSTARMSPPPWSCTNEAIAVAGKPVPTDLLMQMTGDLGATGHPDVMLKEAASLLDVEQTRVCRAPTTFSTPVSIPANCRRLARCSTCCSPNSRWPGVSRWANGRASSCRPGWPSRPRRPRRSRTRAR